MFFTGHISDSRYIMEVKITFQAQSGFFFLQIRHLKMTSYLGNQVWSGIKAHNFFFQISKLGYKVPKCLLIVDCWLSLVGRCQKCKVRRKKTLLLWFKKETRQKLCSPSLLQPLFTCCFEASSLVYSDPFQLYRSGCLKIHFPLNPSHHINISPCNLSSS